MKSSAQPLRKNTLPPAVLVSKNPAVAFSFRGLPEPAFKDAYAGESNQDVLSLAQGLIEEGKISSMLEFVRMYGDIHQSLRSRGIANQLRLFDDIPVPANPFPKHLPLEDFSMADARRLELKGKAITERQMYRLICYVCFNLGTNKAFVGTACSDDTTIKNKMRQKLNGDRETSALFESCLQKMRMAGAVLEIKKTKGFRMLTINNRPGSITDEAIREVVGQALTEHRSLFGRG